MAYLGDDTRQWFVMRDLRRVNAKDTAYQLLMKGGYEAFTPMSLEKNKETGKKELVPILHWLLFLHASKKEIDAIIDPQCPKIPYLQYNYERGKSTRYGGMVVDDRSMAYFRIALTKQEIPIIYRYDDITPAMKGRRVLVVRGEMAGYQGYLQKYTGGKNMKLFVELEGFCLAPIQISPEDIKLIDDKPEKKRHTNDEAERIHYSRLSKMVDIINYLRFSLPQEPKTLDNVQLLELQRTYMLAKQLFDEYKIKEYLCVDEVCKDKLAEINNEIRKRGNMVYTRPPQSQWVARMQQLCQNVRMTGQETPSTTKNIT